MATSTYQVSVVAPFKRSSDEFNHYEQIYSRSQRLYAVCLLSQPTTAVQGYLLYATHGKYSETCCQLSFRHLSSFQYCKKFRVGEKCCEFECLDAPEEIAAAKVIFLSIQMPFSCLCLFNFFRNSYANEESFWGLFTDVATKSIRSFI